MAVQTFQYNSSIGEVMWKYLSLYDMSPSNCLPKTDSTFKMYSFTSFFISRTHVLPYFLCPQFASGSYYCPDSLRQWNQETCFLAFHSSHGLCSVVFFMSFSSYGLFFSANATSEYPTLLSYSCWFSNMVSVECWPPSMNFISEMPWN